MGQIKCKRAMRRISNQSEALTVIACGCKFPRIEKITEKKKKVESTRIGKKVRAFKPGELLKVWNTCGIPGSITKIAAYAIHQLDAMKPAEKAKTKAVIAKFKAGKENRFTRWMSATSSPKKVSKRAPKGTLPKVKEPIAVHQFIPKNEKKRIEAARIRRCKMAKLAKAA